MAFRVSSRPGRVRTSLNINDFFAEYKKRRGPGPARPVRWRERKSTAREVGTSPDRVRLATFRDFCRPEENHLGKNFGRKTFFETADALQERYFSTRTFSGLRRHNTSRFPTRNRAPKVRRARLCATHGRSARVAAVEASDSPRERTRGANAGGRAAPERAERRVACACVERRFCSAGEVRLRAATRRGLIAAGARVRDRERPTRGLPSRFQQRPDSPRATGPRAPPAAALYLPGVSPGEACRTHLS